MLTSSYLLVNQLINSSSQRNWRWSLRFGWLCSAILPARRGNLSHLSTCLVRSERSESGRAKPTECGKRPERRSGQHHDHQLILWFAERLLFFDFKRKLSGATVELLEADQNSECFDHFAGHHCYFTVARISGLVDCDFTNYLNEPIK